MSSIRTENLFRQQAIQSLRRKTPGRPICLMPRAWTWIGTLVVLLVVSAAVFLGTVEYARKESARGWLVSKPGVNRIVLSSSAMVREVVRDAGEHIQAGEPLIYLSTDSLLSGGYSKHEALLSQLRRDLVEIDSQLELSLRHQKLEIGSLMAQLQHADAEINSLTRQISDQRRRIAVSSDQLQRLRKVAAQGAVSDWDLLQQQQDLGALHQELSALQQRMASYQQGRESINSQEKGVPLQSRIERSELRLQRSRLTQQIAEYESRRLAVINSPVTGIVASIEVHAGNTVAAQTLLMTVLPDNVELSAEIYLPSRAAGLVRPGQEVRLLYDAFPQQEFGFFRGSVDRISDFVLLPADLPQAFPLPEASYKLSVSIRETSVMTDLGAASLRPGMLLVAEIVLEKRKLLTWLLEPLGLDRGPGV